MIWIIRQPYNIHEKPPEEQREQIDTDASVADCARKKKEENDDIVYKLYLGNDSVFRLA